MICQACGSNNPPKAKYCNECGSSLLAVPTPDNGENPGNNARMFMMIAVLIAAILAGAVMFLFAS